MQSDIEHRREVKERVLAGWNGWRRVTSVIRNRWVSSKVEKKVHNTKD